jgi:ABC-2 type transport system ATP-binding protein
VLAVRGLDKRYGDVVALDGASFVASPGRILGFLGPNGAGKTTTMRVIFGLVEPDAGDVTWADQAITDADRRRFGYMPEERGLYPKMGVREQVVHFARLSGMGSQDAVAATNRWLALLGIDDRANSKVEELSHGNQQRVQLAAALVHNPVLLVLDEPFAGLDPLGVDSLSATLQDLANKGTAIVFSSHQLDLVKMSAKTSPSSTEVGSW